MILKRIAQHQGIVVYIKVLYIQTTVLKRLSGALHYKKNRELISRVFNIMLRR